MAARGTVITANILIDGVTVYLTDRNEWTETLSQARFFTDESEAQSLLDRAEEDVARRVSAREHIRASGGPTIPYIFS
jgi:hypothetical protein